MAGEYIVGLSLDGSTSRVVTESQVLKEGQGVLREIITNATSTGTLRVIDGTEPSVAGAGTLTSSGACVPASHAQNVLTSSGAMVAGSYAVSVLTGDAIVEGNVVVIDTTTYTYKNIPTQANHIKVGSTTEISLANLYKAIKASGNIGVDYGFGTVAHPKVIATASDATTLTVRSRDIGTTNNAIATTGTALRTVWADTTLGGGTGASDAGVTAANATITLDTTVYTVVEALAESYGLPAVPYQVKKGANEAAMIANLKKAINGTGIAGTDYGTGTVAHPYFVCSASDATTLTIRSRRVGNAAFTTLVNALATTETMANTAWADSTCGGGTGNANPAVTSDAATITIGTRVYTAVLELDETVGASATADQILWVTSEAVFLDNIKLAINGSGKAGTDYSTGTTRNTQVVATTNSATQQVIGSILLGASQNTIATTTTLANYAWGAATLASGVGATGKVILETYTPTAGAALPISNVELEYGLSLIVGGTSISATVVYK